MCAGNCRGLPSIRQSRPCLTPQSLASSRQLPFQGSQDTGGASRIFYAGRAGEALRADYNRNRARRAHLSPINEATSVPYKNPSPQATPLKTVSRQLSAASGDSAERAHSPFPHSRGAKYNRNMRAAHPALISHIFYNRIRRPGGHLHRIHASTHQPKLPPQAYTHSLPPPRNLPFHAQKRTYSHAYAHLCTYLFASFCPASTISIKSSLFSSVFSGCTQKIVDNCL